MSVALTAIAAVPFLRNDQYQLSVSFLAFALFIVALVPFEKKKQMHGDIRY